MTNPTCETCRFFAIGSFNVLAHKYDGTCRIRSTHVSTANFTTKEGDTFSYMLFPPRNMGNWCGEHKPKEKVDE